MKRGDHIAVGFGVAQEGERYRNESDVLPIDSLEAISASRKRAERLYDRLLQEFDRAEEELREEWGLAQEYDPVEALLTPDAQDINWDRIKVGGTE